LAAARTGAARRASSAGTVAKLMTGTITLPISPAAERMRRPSRTRSPSRGPLCKCDRGAHKVAFADLDAAMAQNIVGSRVMKIAVR
jgi:hypothetical protein